MGCLERSSVFIEENSPRDGIQNESISFSLEERVSLVNALAVCGFRRIQIGAFVDSRKVPQMAHTEKVLERIRQMPGVTYSALVLNEKGMERAIASGIGHVSLFVSATDTHSLRNANCSAEEGLAMARRAVSRAKAHGLQVQGGIMNAFHCRFEGVVAPARVLQFVGSLVEMDVDEINLADSAGLAHPAQVEQLVGRVLEESPVPITLHLHDTLGFGIANAYAAWKAGAHRFDASCGGLGGCPFIPGAAGNVATEDLVNLFESMGVQTGIHLPGLVAVVKGLGEKLNRIVSARYSRLHGESGERSRA